MSCPERKNFQFRLIPENLIEYRKRSRERKRREPPPRTQTRPSGNVMGFLDSDNLFFFFFLYITKNFYSIFFDFSTFSSFRVVTLQKNSLSESKKKAHSGYSSEDLVKEKITKTAKHINDIIFHLFVALNRLRKFHSLRYLALKIITHGLHFANARMISRFIRSF